MSDKLVECVPNFSEGRDLSIIQQITDVIESIPDVELKDVDPGEATNRTVVTFIGSPSGVAEAAFQAIKKASQIIDMRNHKGTHPRFGATDVCPFVPVEGVTMEDCVEIAKQVGKRVGEELEIPVYLYENAAQAEDRHNLATVRKGQYEGLKEKLADPHWKPDFGPAKFNAKSGATAISAREFLIAYNVTLNTDERKYATDIAFELRYKGRSVRKGDIDPFYFKGKLIKYREGYYPCGECEFESDNYHDLTEHVKKDHGYDLSDLLSQHNIKPPAVEGFSVRKRGIFTNCKSIGWFVEEYGRAQISINLTNYKITPPHIVLEKVRELAAKRGLVVTGSEIVGLVPYQAMLMAGKYYLKKQSRSTGIPPQDIIDVAIYSMGLNDVAPFDPHEKIIGLPKLSKDSLVAMGSKEFVDEVSRSSPAPGGGSVAAICGALGAALSSMAANLASINLSDRERFTKLVEFAEEAQELRKQLIDSVDKDSNAFNSYLAAMRLPKKTNEEKALRKQAMQEALKEAVMIPFETAVLSGKAVELSCRVAELAKKSSVSDAGVSGQSALSGVTGGVLNVLINLGDIEDEQFVADMKSKCEKLEEEAKHNADKVLRLVKNRIEE